MKTSLLYLLIGVALGSAIVLLPLFTLVEMQTAGNLLSEPTLSDRLRDLEGSYGAKAQTSSFSFFYLLAASFTVAVATYFLAKRRLLD